MPVQLNYTDQVTGLNVNTSYWFAQYAEIDNINNILNVTMNGYFTVAAKNAGKTPFNRVQLRPTFAQLGLSGATTLSQMLSAIYTFALTDAFFSGGTIV